MVKIHYPKIYRLTLSTAATKHIPRNIHRRALMIWNDDPALNVEIRSEPGTSGILLKPESCYENKDYPQDAIWLRSTSGTPIVHIQEDIEEEVHDAHYVT